MKRFHFRFTCIAISLAMFTACTDTEQEAAASTDSAIVVEAPKDSLTQKVVLDSLNARIMASPNNPDVYKARAEYHWLKEDVLSALADLELGLKADSNRADLYFAKGEIYYTSAQYDLAMTEYQKCVEKDLGNIDCLLRVAEMNVHLKQYSKAIQNVNDALKVDDQLPLAYYIKGRIYKETGDTSLAASSYQTAIEVDPDYYDAYIEVGLLYASAGSDLAIEYYNTALGLRPQSVEALYDMAYYKQSTGFRNIQRYQEALDLYNEILILDPTNAAAAFNQGFIHLEYLQDYRSGLERFTKALELYPQYYQALYNRGLCQESLENSEEALKDYNRALALKPDFTAAAIAKGRVLGDN